jgi:2-succinyl-5-enolpyruvyl-6-hydroxy-3-cyclohexene-1-carboxylate synthase
MTGPTIAGEDVQAAFCETLVDEWVRAGVTDAVVAPGSRSTPLLVALDSNARIRLHVVLDERVAGFVALGIGRATGRPAPVVTTSGTAAVELHPAVVEADHGMVPLLAVTADRPPELQQVGAPQTIVQDGLYGRSVRWSFSPGVADLGAALSWRSLAARSVSETRDGPGGPGPVHLNLAFREPLLGDARRLPAGSLPAAREGGDPWHALRSGPSADAEPLSPEVVDAFRAASGGPGVVVAGADAGAPQGVIAVARALGWPVLADPLSGCRIPDRHVVAAADALLRVGEVASWTPSVVLRLGRPPASKVLSQWLAGLGSDVLQVLVDPFGRWPDPERAVATVLRSDPSSFARRLLGALSAGGPGDEGEAAGTAPASPWLAGWADAEAAAQAAIDGAIAAEGVLSEPDVARALVAALADGATLVVSSSMPVRDVEWFAAPRSSLRVVANRGANGIDGVVSTALGVALGATGPVAALLGDLAFVYDAGALLWARERPIDCTVVVVDNDGGGIFSFLPQAQALAGARFERLWATPHRLDLAALARSYGAPAEQVGDVGQLAEVLQRRSGGLRVVVARTDRATNVAVHDRIHSSVAAAVREVVRGA